MQSSRARLDFQFVHFWPIGIHQLDRSSMASRQSSLLSFLGGSNRKNSGAECSKQSGSGISSLSLPAGSSDSEVNELSHSPPPSVTLGMESESSSLALASSDSEVSELGAAEVRDGDSAALSGVIGGGPPAKRSRSHCTHHRQSGFDGSWHKKYPWLLYNSEEQSMYCQLCIKYKKLPRNGSGKWVTVGTTTFRQDKLVKHEHSSMHKDAEHCRREEAHACASGGIRAALEVTVSQERRAVIGALKCLYFLAKNELPHTTNFSSLLDLAISLGYDYMKELCHGGNASYRSEQTMAEFLFSLYKCIKKNVMTEMHRSSSISIMVDESTDVAIY